MPDLTEILLPAPALARLLAATSHGADHPVLGTIHQVAYAGRHLVVLLYPDPGQALIYDRAGWFTVQAPTLEAALIAYGAGICQPADPQPLGRFPTEAQR